MTLTNTNTMFKKAMTGKYAIGAFNVNNLEFIQAAANAAKAQKSPIILQTSEGAIKYAGIEYIKAMLEVAQKEAKVPIALHLDHGKDMDVIKKCIKVGYTSVMFDGSSLSYKDNIKFTKKIVSMANPKGITVESELGVLAGVEDNVSAAQNIYTDPEQALDFVQKTGTDSLAVAIGTSHGAYKFTKEAKLDIKRLQQIKNKVNIPLVLHGASSVPSDLNAYAKKNGLILGNAKGVPTAQLKQAISHGVCKINTDTDLRIAFTAKTREMFNNSSKEFDPRKYLGPAREFTQKLIEQKIKDFGSNNKA